MEARVPIEKIPPPPDNGVPGPGNYEPDDKPSVPNFKIEKRSPKTK